ncbi:MAG TPA: fibronectin type III domain-containing protein [Kofleriaceae bacterium]
MTSRAVLAIATLAAIHGVTARATAEPPKPSGLRSRPVQLIGRPVLESATPDSAVIRWTDTTGGGTDTHYGIVRYGLDPRHLDRTTRSPNRARNNATTMTYRVWIDGLAPSTTYYYTVDAARADGNALGLHSPVSTFTTRPRS